MEEAMTKTTSGAKAGVEGANRRKVLGGLAGGVLAALVPARRSFAAAAYPDRPIRLVVPFAPGGAIDMIARLAAKYLTDELGQRVYVETRSGAGGSIGTAFVVKSDPDGYSLIMHSVSSAVMNSLVYKKLPYDILKDSTPVAEVAQSPTLLVINKDLPAKNLREFIALVKENPGKFNYGSTGIGSSVQMGSVLFESLTGTHMVHIPFRGGGEAVKELVAGQTQMELGSIGVFLSFIRSGQLRVLCVNDSKRTPVLPDVPTAKEAGLDNFVLPDWYAIFGPKGMPPDVVERLDAAVKKILARPDMQKQMLAAAGLTPAMKTSEELGEFWREEFAFWAPIV
jgi:tripartite-type tricarboxylate transporter receptor subunit TctC